ncbi:MAG: UvrB/UvrC motif-containing protein [Lachnospiraceae bacterium]|nr:UvrB/UvrC motif-containing protein [Lachnospiraceae bacterium]
MLCEICHENEAHVVYTEIINGVKKEQHLCESCAVKQSPFNLMGKIGPDVQFGNILSGLLQSFAKGLNAMQEKESICGRCGMTASEFAKTGKLGCPDCYGAFAPILDKNLKTLQGAVENKGKKPMNAVYFEPAKYSRKDAVQNPDGSDRENPLNDDNEQTPGDVLGAAGTIEEILGSDGPEAIITGRNAAAKPAKLSKEAAVLRKLMEKAVKEENYELAAQLRDRLRKLEESTGGREEKDNASKVKKKNDKTARSGKSIKNGKEDKPVKKDRSGKESKTGTGRKTQKEGLTGEESRSGKRNKSGKNDKSEKNGDT